MPIEHIDSGSERELVSALVYFETLRVECVSEGRHGFALLMEDHAADIRRQLVKEKHVAGHA